MEKNLRFHLGYNIIFKSIQNRSGGGVLLMIKKNIPFEIINAIDKFDTEALCVKNFSVFILFPFKYKILLQYLLKKLKTIFFIN